MLDPIFNVRGDETDVLLSALNLLSLLWDQGLQRQLPPGNRNVHHFKKNPLTFKQVYRNMCRLG